MTGPRERCQAAPNGTALMAGAGVASEMTGWVLVSLPAPSVRGKAA